MNISRVIPVPTPTRKPHLATIKMLFDWLVTGQAVSVNPASSVRGPKHIVRKGKTPALSAVGGRNMVNQLTSLN